MSMISTQIDKLRQMADGQATYRDARVVMLQAADTITELHGALLVASVDYRHLSDENAKLRELVRDMWFWGYCGHMDSKSQEWQMKHIDDVLDRMRELVIEVDDGNGC